ncbi:MAG: M14 family metallopeptidase [Saprospiraceae bacterium]|nr:M14 family metallopeptidase [Saprospiraceae bacterium]
MKKLQLLLPLLLLFHLLNAQTQKDFKLFDERLAYEPNLPYDANIPSPEKVLGYRMGERFTVHAEVVNYFKALDAASNKLIINEYGRTYEHRPLLNLVITSEANHARLEELRTRHLKLTDPTTTSTAEAEQIIKNDPIFLSYSYNIHGNEASSTEAAMQVAYRLAAATDAETKNILDNMVIILYICINPDGRDRYVQWYNSVRRNVTGYEPNDMEHFEDWPGGRSNHYWFDVNRDWVWGVHPEGRDLTKEYQKWMPQVHTDYHEQGYNSNYFTMPGTTPRNKLLPDSYEAWSDTFGKANIRVFDKFQINYFTRDAFDFFYPGYGSSYPSVQGAIGMLTEQGGGNSGIAVETDDGTVLTLQQRVFDHFSTSIATIKATLNNKEALLRYSYDTWNPKNSKSPTKAYFLPDDNSNYLYDVIHILLHHNIKVERATADITVADAKNFRTNKSERKVFPKGTYIISTNQPRYLFINSIMERNMVIEDSVMYDMATWSAPIAYNLDAYATNTALKITSEEVKTAPTHVGKVNNPNPQYAYVIEWKQRHAPRALAMLWEKEYRVRAASEPFTDGARKYGAGSLIILRGRNLEKAADIQKDMQEIAEKAGVNIDGHNTGRMLDGYDLASTRNRPVLQPKVALMVDRPFSSLTAGQISFLFDQEIKLPVERIKSSLLRQTAIPKFGGSVDLKDYEVLILPGGGNGLNQLFGKDQLDQLKAWVQAGGVLIATEDAAPFFTNERSKMTSVKLLELKRDSSEAATMLPFADRTDFFGKKRVPGTAFNAKLDTTHPLAFGMDKELYTLKYDNLAFKPDPDLQTVGTYNKDNLLVAGYANEENQKNIAGNTFAGVLPMGQGKVVFLLDNTQFRMFWRGPTRMMENAVMLLKSF